MKRTHDYEPFIREFFTSLHNEGLLNPMLGRNEDGKKLPAARKAKGKASRS
jgi:ubiquitin carboxyl-terminal hydrolase L5